MVKELSIGFGRSVKSVGRKEWGARTPGTVVPYLEPPADHFLLTDTGSACCHDVVECRPLVRQLQEDAMDNGFADIFYNFLIGGDGTVYRGRGWFKRAQLNGWNDWINHKCIEIAYIGDFYSTDVPFNMLSSALDLMKYGVKRRKVDTFFKLLGFSSQGKQ